MYTPLQSVNGEILVAVNVHGIPGFNHETFKYHAEQEMRYYNEKQYHWYLCGDLNITCDNKDEFRQDLHAQLSWGSHLFANRSAQGHDVTSLVYTNMKLTHHPYPVSGEKLKEHAILPFEEIKWVTEKPDKHLSWLVDASCI